jgi:enoyl-CoA hydratase
VTGEASGEVSGDPAPVLVERRGRLGVLTLDRPRAINALTREMVGLVADALDAWEHDDAVGAVLVTGAGERGLCAGGDVVGLRAATGGADPAPALDFWQHEYRLNARIARYPKPYVALMDGLVLGGGVGISAHGSHRVVTERTRLGMPETGIGFVPDVGGTWLLAQAPGELGTHLGLTGAMVPGEDAILLGMADSYVPADRLPALAAALETEEPDAAIAAVAEHPPASALARDRAWIDAAYAGSDLGVILARLASGSAAAREAAAVLAGRSPTALALTLRSLRLAATDPDLETTLRREYRVSVHCLAMPDFGEGIRAQLVDKDRSPRWSPATLAEVDPALVAGATTAVDPELRLAD